jgi:hypothetical protein
MIDEQEANHFTVSADPGDGCLAKSVIWELSAYADRSANSEFVGGRVFGEFNCGCRVMRSWGGRG